MPFGTVKSRRVACFAAFAALVAALLAALVACPVVIASGTAGASTPCGPAGQPCTWNFSPLGSGGGGADVYAAEASGREGAGVLVAVVDTWVDRTHPAFGGRVVDEADCVGAGASGTADPNACQDNHYAQDGCFHGTHVAGTIASSNFGVAPRASILAVQVLTDQGNGDCSGQGTDVAAGIVFAVRHGARVINLSVGDLVPGFTQDPDITAAVQQAAAAGAVVVFAAGNTGVGITDDYGSGALLVAATGPSGQLAGYSDRGGSVNLAAPGGDDGAVGVDFNGCNPDGSNCILSTIPGNQYGLLEGTSMAAPHVSGTAALLIAENPGRSRADVIHALEATAHPLSGAGSGLIDAGAALALEAPPAQSGTSAAHPAPAPAPSVTTRPAGVPVHPASVSGSVSAVSGGGVVTAPTIAGTSTTTSVGTAVPNATPAQQPSGGSPPKRSAAPADAGATGGGAGGGSIAAAGAVAALLLLLTGAGTGMFALRRRA